MGSKTGKPGTKSIYNKEDLIAAVIKMRLEEMASVKTIIDFLTEKIGMSKTTAYQYLNWAREEIKDQYDLMNPSKIEEAIGQYEEALERARMSKDWRLWNDLKKELNKIQGVYAKERIDITTNDTSINEVVIKIITDKNDLNGEDLL
jgi:hypothetical protein